MDGRWFACCCSFAQAGLREETPRAHNRQWVAMSHQWVESNGKDSAYKSPTVATHAGLLRLAKELRSVRTTSTKSIHCVHYAWSPYLLLAALTVSRRLATRSL